jgi:hypothetical protein
MLGFDVVVVVVVVVDQSSIPIRHRGFNISTTLAHALPVR